MSCCMLPQELFGLLKIRNFDRAELQFSSFIADVFHPHISLKEEMCFLGEVKVVKYGCRWSLSVARGVYPPQHPKRTQCLQPGNGSSWVSFSTINPNLSVSGCCFRSWVSDSDHKLFLGVVLPSHKSCSAGGPALTAPLPPCCSLTPLRRHRAAPMPRPTPAGPCSAFHCFGQIAPAS